MKYNRFAIRIRLICFNFTRFSRVYRTIDSSLSRFTEIKCQIKCHYQARARVFNCIYYEYIPSNLRRFNFLRDSSPILNALTTQAGKFLYFYSMHDGEEKRHGCVNNKLKGVKNKFDN